VTPRPPTDLACEQHASCPTCADAAVAMRVVALATAPLQGARCVAADGTQELVALDLVDASVGDEVLVHAGVAIARTTAAKEEASAL
jgi:hydrogenase maturation factor